MLIKACIVLLIVGIILIVLAGPTKSPLEQFAYQAGQACLTIATLLGCFYVLGAMKAVGA